VLRHDFPRAELALEHYLIDDRGAAEEHLARSATIEA
jgi:hypothetical protein